MAVSIKKSQFRQRVYQMPDESIVLIFGNDPAPEGGKLLADHDISEIATVTDHIEPEQPK